MKKVTPKVKKAVSKKASPLYTHTTDEVKRYIGAVSEDFQHRVSAIAEQFLSLNDKIDANTQNLNDKIDANTQNLNDKIDANTKRLEGKLDVHTEMIGRLMIDVEEIKVGMGEKVNRSDFNKLESRLVTLESFVFSNQGKTPKVSK